MSPFFDLLDPFIRPCFDILGLFLVGRASPLPPVGVVMPHSLDDLPREILAAEEVRGEEGFRVQRSKQYSLAECSHALLHSSAAGRVGARPLSVGT